jgi:anthranilate synthase/aminodeoxychorismate synthase-like glutamine amidotransferase
MILIVDNYDSFTYNLVQSIGALGHDPVVVLNDRATVEQVRSMRPDRIVISPGPCSPREAGISNAIVRALAPEIPILGVCLGHQCLAHVFGGEVVRAREPRHGKVSWIRHDGRTIFAGMPSPFAAMRYNSLIVREETLSPDLEVAARSETGEIMALRHRRYPAEGVQFHPESYRTPEGIALLRNFLERS